MLFWGLAMVAAGCIVLRLAVASAGVRGGYLYYGTEMHADPIVIGCAAACWLGSHSSDRVGTSAATRLRWRWFGAAALAVIVVSQIRLGVEAHFRYLIPISCVAVATAVVILDTLIPGSWLARIFSARALVWLGTRSYGIYLWHYPVFFLGGALWGYQLGFQPEHVAPCWLITLIVAEVSFRLIERPALRLKGRLRDHACSATFSDGVVPAFRASKS